MSGFLLDTNCISEVVRPQPDRGVVKWLETADERQLYLSVLTLGEIRRGIATLAQGRRRSLLEHWLETELTTRFSGRIVPVDAAVADCWGRLTGDARRKGRPLAVVDALLAATALHYNLILVTRNASDFTGTSAQVLNLWETV